jgi:predicted DNA-binding ribbon-helix-helix protein
MKPRRPLKSPIARHAIRIAGHKTTISLEDQFWEELREIATERRTTLQDLVTSINRDRREGSLSSTIRLYVLRHYQNQIAARTPSA